MPRARKKPVEIEYELWDGTLGEAMRIREWAGHVDGDPLNAHLSVTGDFDTPTFEVSTLEGAMRVSPGDYVIRGVKGELYPCKPDIFLATYDLVEYPDGSQSIGDHHG